VVEKLKWAPGNAELTAHTADGTQVFSASRVLITLPLALLKAPCSAEPGVIEFVPSLPRQKLQALEKLETGKVIRVVLRFRHHFWEKLSPGGPGKTLSEMSFLFSEDEWFPTWWTTMPAKLPIITGWAPFRAAERLSCQCQSFVVDHSLQTLSRLLKVSAREIESILDAAYFHDWQSDPFSLGAYSYAKFGADDAQKVLASPLDNTLFFAGEATDTSGHNGTVHGAISSGYRAASEILQASGV
jgi:monoamine oxidase